MTTFLFRCPNTGLKVQARAEGDPGKSGEHAYEPVICMACEKVHFVDPGSGIVLLRDADER